jgi:ubiquinone biosynthesis protein
VRPLAANLRRLGHIGRVLARHGLSLLLGRPEWRRLIRPGGRLARRLPPPDLPGPERLRLVLEELGGTFIKLGQMLALQPDILSLEYCNALFKLLDRVEPFPYADVERTFLEELGRPPEAVFDRFERDSFAAASIGQVHRALLGERLLAVKVRRPTA